MTQKSLPYDIVDEEVSDGISLALRVAGQTIGRARVSSFNLIELARSQSPSEIRADLEQVLTDYLGRQLELVRLGTPEEVPAGSLVFVAPYTFREEPELTHGVVRYDVNRGIVSPEHVPPVVQTRMRAAVNHELSNRMSQLAAGLQR